MTDAPTDHDDPSPSSSSLMKGKTCLADYNVGKAIGKGKFSVVFSAQYSATNVPVALKKINVFSSMDSKSRTKCLKEIKLIKSLEHENIIQYRDSFVENDELLIVFEWANAGDLKRQIRKANERNQKFETRVILKYFSQIVRAVEFMHSKRVIHRDIKPANIFLMTDGTVKVGDLGLSRLLSDETMEAYSKVGTPLYMAPELLRNDGYDWKSDIWSLGCILYELLELRSPFKEEGLSLVTLFKKISKGAFNPIDDSSFYPKALVELTNSMLRLNPEDRPTATGVAKIVSKEDPGRTRRRRLVGVNMENTIILLMDELLDLLNLLDYDELQITRIHFIFDLGKIGTIPGYHRHRQFSEFMQVCSWLLKRCSISFQYTVEDSPSMTASALLTTLQRAHISGELIGTISPSQLSEGFGYAVVSVLKWLAELALFKHQAFKFCRPQYLRNEDDIVDVADQVQEPPSEESEVSSECESDEDQFSDDDTGVYINEKQKQFKRILLPMLGNPSVDAANDWNLEVERLAPRLRSKIRDRDVSWRQRLECLRTSNIALLCKDEVTQQLGTMRDKLNGLVKEISRGEQRLTSDFASVASEYRELNAERDELMRTSSKHGIVVETLVQELDQLADEVEQSSKCLLEKSNAISNSSKPKQLKTSLLKLKKDIRQMDIKIALLLQRLDRNHH